MAGRYARPDRDAFEGELHPPLGRDAKRRGDGAHPLQADWRLPANHRDHLRPGLLRRAVHPDQPVLDQRPRSPDAALSVRRGHRNRGSARERAAPTAGEGHPAGAESRSHRPVRIAVRGAPGWRRDDVSRVHRKDEVVPAAADGVLRNRGARSMSRLYPVSHVRSVRLQADHARPAKAGHYALSKNALAWIAGVAGIVMLWFTEGVSTQAGWAWTPPIPRADDGAVHVEPVRDNISMLVGAGGNITVSAGDDGVLMVDGGSAAMAEKVLAAVRTISRGPIRYLVNTNER